MGDLTTHSIFTSTDRAKGTFTSKASGIIAGMAAIELTYSFFGTDVTIKSQKKDGNHVQIGEVIAEVEGPVISLLSGERVILNMLQHVSGIATSTSELVQLLDDPSTEEDIFPGTSENSMKLEENDNEADNFSEAAQNLSDKDPTEDQDINEETKEDFLSFLSQMLLSTL